MSKERQPTRSVEIPIPKATKELASKMAQEYIDGGSVHYSEFTRRLTKGMEMNDGVNAIRFFIKEIDRILKTHETK